jgi:hypothetical protein
MKRSFCLMLVLLACILLLSSVSWSATSVIVPSQEQSVIGASPPDVVVIANDTFDNFLSFTPVIQ